MGLKSHGVIRIPQYLDDIAAGGIDPAAAPIVGRPLPGRAAVDGGKGFGQVVGMAMAGRGRRSRRRQTGVAFVTGRHMGHTGRIGAYPRRSPARAASASSSAAGRARVTGWRRSAGSRAGSPPIPIAYAYPVAGGAPVVADFSTSVVPEGVVRSLMNRGLPAPEGAIRDPGRNAHDRPAAPSMARRAAPSSRSAAPSAIAARLSASWSTCSPRCSPTTRPTT